MNGYGALVGLLMSSAIALVLADPYPWRGRRFTRRVLTVLQPSLVSIPRALGPHRVRAIEERQRLAGLHADSAAHVLMLVTWTACGLGIGTLAVVLLIGIGAVRNAAATVLLIGVCGISGWLLGDRRLGALAKHRREQAALELPGVAETLALAVGAGAALPHAIERITQRANGVLISEFRLAVDAIRAGATLDAALAAIPARLPIPSVLRFTDAIRIALERGTPIVDVLHAQATDARAESRRLLMERAGKREAAMLIPVVFLVLPAIVVVALYPGYRELALLT